MRPHIKEVLDDLPSAIPEALGEWMRRGMDGYIAAVRAFVEDRAGYDHPALVSALQAKAENIVMGGGSYLLAWVYDDTATRLEWANELRDDNPHTQEVYL